MENVIAWTAGFVSAYLIIRGLSRLGGALVFLLACSSAVYGNGLFKFCNSAPAGNPSLNFERMWPEPFTQEWEGAGGGVLPGACTGGSSTAAYGTWRWRATTTTGGIEVGEGTFEVFDGADVTVNVSSVPNTYYEWSGSVTNTLAYDRVYLAIQYDTNGAPVSTNSFEVKAHEVKSITMQNPDELGNVGLFAPGDQTNDYVWQAAGTIAPSEHTTYATPTVNTAFDANLVNPIPTSGFTPQSTNAIQQSVENTAAILKALGEIGGAIVSGNARIATNAPGSGSSTNVHDPINRGELQEIKTNLASGLDYLTGTNFGWTAALSNALVEAGNAGFLAMSNQLGSAFSDGLAGLALDLTNQAGTFGQGAGTSADGDEGPLTVKFGTNNEHTFSLDLRKMVAGQLGESIQTMAGKVLDALTWLRYWLVLIIDFVLWWAIYGAVRERINLLSVPAGLQSPKAIEWQGILGSLTLGLALMTALTTVIMTIPTQAAIFTSGFYVNPGTAHQIPGGGPVADLQTRGMDGPSGPMTATALAWWDVYTMVVPLDILFAAIMNYLGFLLWGDRLIDFCFAGLRALKLSFARLVIFGLVLWGSGSVAMAAEVSVWNGTTNTLVISNEVEVLAFPPGLWTGNLAAGAWSSGPVAWEFLDSEWVRANLRFGWDETGTNVVASVSGSRTAAGAFLMGHSTGWAVFGMLLMVQYLRKGLNVGAASGP